MMVHVSIAAILIAGFTLLVAEETTPITQDALNAAPEAEVERLGVVQCMGRIAGSAMSKGTAQYPPRVLVSFWSMADRSFFATFVVDLSTGKVREVTEPGFEADAPRWPSAMNKDGKHFLSCMRGGLAVYDPADDSIKMVRPIPRASWLRGIAIGADGAVYVSDYPTGSAARTTPRLAKASATGLRAGHSRSRASTGTAWGRTASGCIPRRARSPGVWPRTTARPASRRTCSSSTRQTSRA